MKKLPCGWAFRLPNFCKNRKCANCPLNKETGKRIPKGAEKEKRK